MGREKIDRTGEENYNNFGTLMKIVEYKNAKDIIVEFQDEYKIKKSATYQQFKKGNIKNPYDKIVCSVGYVGEGRYDKKDYPYIYEKWHNMLKRCYEAYVLNKYSTYRDCTVCDEWLCFQNFAQWWEENYYEIEGERMCLDKDILIKSNKIYSPETCLIVPQRINTLFIKSDAIRGKYPLGVYWNKENNKFRAQCSVLNKENNKEQIYLGLYSSVEETFLVYKNFKEKYIKQIADEYKDIIPTKLYNALYSYEVEIND